MDTAMWIEIFGYIGSFLVVVSMLMSSVVKLRLINTVGSVISGTYAIICGAFPLVLMNACLIIINIYNLYKLLKAEQTFDIAEGSMKDGFLQYFLDCYLEDIQRYFPGFDELNPGIEKAYYVCCNGAPAGIILGKEKEGTFEVVLDYSTPAYRDCSVGKFLYCKLQDKGIKKLVFAQNISDTHADYLKKMGFVKEHDAYVKILK